MASEPSTAPPPDTVVRDHKEEEQQNQPLQCCNYSKRVPLKSIVGRRRRDGGLGLAGERVVVGGWVKSRKEKPTPHDQQQQEASSVLPPPPPPGKAQDVSCCCEVLVSRVPIFRPIKRLFMGRNVGGEKQGSHQARTPVAAYLLINDGSCIDNLQLVIDPSMSLVGQVIGVGSSILAQGTLQKASLAGNHVLELRVEKILHVGVTDLHTYPLAKKKLSLELLRAYPHFRPRANTAASITRIRNDLSYAAHIFFQNNGFLHVHMPVITTLGARDGSKISGKSTKSLENLSELNAHEAVDLELVKAAIGQKRKRINELQRTDSNKDALFAAEQDLRKANELAIKLEKIQKSTPSPIGEVNFSNDLLSRPAYLSVSARIHLEAYACGMSNVYAFGPVFEAEDSQSMKYVAEMWMVEAELAFTELEDAMSCAENLLKFLSQSVQQNCEDDLKFMSKQVDKNIILLLQSIDSGPFARITYSEAIDIINKAENGIFKTKVEWGMKLSKEHESYLADEIYKGPVIIYGYPKESKPFYVNVRNNGETASAFDIIVPKTGVLVRGSQKEERFDVISKRIEELGLVKEDYAWYLDLCKNGTIKHSGFSLGFEHMVMFATGIDDIRDVIPFPRTPNIADM